MVPAKPDLQCGFGPRAQYSDDLYADERGGSRLGDFVCTARADAAGLTRRYRMPRKRSKIVSLPIVEPDAAGIDVGAPQIFVAVPAGRDSEPGSMVSDVHRRLAQAG
jgi:hypothetical protein